MIRIGPPPRVRAQLSVPEHAIIQQVPALDGLRLDRQG